ncbi:MAG: helix-turn-helix transcriptional regulator [Planctomycetota bacterium]
MAKGFRIGSRDRRGVFEVLSRAEGDREDPRACRRRLVEGALALFGADHGAALMYAVESEEPPAARILEVTLCGEAPAAAKGAFEAWVAGGDPGDSPWLQRTLRLGRPVAADALSRLRRHAWVEQTSFVQDFFIPSGCGDMLVGHVYAKAAGRVYALGVTRDDPGRPYDDRDRRVFRMMMLECQRRYRQGRFMPLVRPLDDASGGLETGLRGERWTAALSTLSPRENEVLDRLLDGLAPKEIAYALGLSTHTVYSHTKALHRKLEVSSRAELLARFITRPAGA